MAGPGGREVGRVSIRVLPDTSKFVPSLRKYLTRIERTLKLEIPVTLDASGIAAEARRATKVAQKAAREVKIPVTYDRKALSSLRKDLGSLKGISVPNFNRQIGLAALTVTAAAAVPHVLALAGSLTQVAGVAGLLPGLLAGMVAGVGTLVIGFQGVGDALKTMNDPKQLEKFQAALKNLAPSARETVRQFKALSPAFRDLRLDVQQNLFEGVARNVKNLAEKYLPTLKDGLRRIAASSNAAFQWVSQAAQAPTVVKEVGAILRSTADFTARMGRAMAALLPAFSTLAQVGASFLPGLADRFGDLADRFNDFIQRVADNGALYDFIQGGIDATKDLMSVLGSAGRILGGISKAAQAGGGSVLGAFADGLKRVADLVNEPSFQSGLTTVFEGIRDAAKPIIDALPAVADALVAVAPGIGSLAKAFGTGLGEALKTFADVVVQLAPTINDWADSLSKLDPKLLGFITAGVVLAPIVGSVVSALAGLAPVLGLIASPVGLVVAGIAALVAGFIAIYNNSATVRDSVGGVISALQDMWTQLQPIVEQIVQVFRDNWPQIAEVAQQAWSTVQTVITTVLDIVSGYITTWTAVVTGLWRLFGDDIVTTIRGALSGAIETVRGGLNLIQGFFRAVAALIRGDWSGLWNAIRQTATGSAQIVRGVVSTLMAFARGQFSAAGSALRAVWTSAWSSISSTVSSATARVSAYVRAIPGRIKTALGDLKGLLVSAGSDVVQGLVNGIRGAAGRVAAAARDLASNIPGPIKKLLGIASPSKVTKAFGAYVGEGLAIGLTGSVSKVRAAAQRLATNLSGTLFRNVSDEVTTLKRLAAQREAMADRLAKAKTKLTAALKVRDDYAASIRQSFANFADITDGGSSAESILINLRNSLAAAKQFKANLAQLTKLGLSKSLYKDIVDAGVEKGGITAAALVAGGKSAVKQVNALGQQLTSAGNSVATTASRALYQAGVDSARGLVKGLQTQTSVLVQAARTLASALVTEIKKALKIHSPSRVFHDIGQMVGLGLTDGVDSMQSLASRSSSELARSLSRGFDPALSLAGVGAASRDAWDRGIVVQGNVGWGPEELVDAIAEQKARESSLFPDFDEVL